MAQGKRAGTITQRYEDQNLALLLFFVYINRDYFMENATVRFSFTS